ncbi:MAG: pyrroline-5-carboxylate reductase [Pseudomonadales bacterium]|nr:pyrroline-5-carboxylate reductase [Pseudomonadales bacterium]
MQQDSIITFIGSGNMASALIGGIVKQGFPANNIIVAGPEQGQLDTLQQQLGVRVTTDNSAAVSEADLVVFAIKPQIFRPVLEDVRAAVAQRKPLLISIAAGITVAAMLDWLQQPAAIVRCMPNTPALVQHGATGMFANDEVSDAQKQQAQSVMDAVGISLWLDTESEIDAVTAVSGSGPAYYFLVMEAMEAAAIEMGLTPDTARRLTQKTALGAAALASEGSQDPAQLRVNVTSPGGTTERALQTFEKGGLKKLFAQAMEDARLRSVELAKLDG